MILASDLRIGNWVQRIGCPLQIVGIKGTDIWVEAKGVEIEYEFYDGFKPIELTDEWLKKFGFVYSDFLESWSLNGIITLELEAGGFFYDRFKIETVNQLQNLYHALTGEEL